MALSITQEELKKRIIYVPETGEMLWIVDLKNNIRAGDPVGHMRDDGYKRCGIGGKLYRINRLAWLYMTGSLPDKKQHVDHINGIRDDNRWENLRLAQNDQNMWNLHNSPRNTSGYKGVCPIKNRPGWWHVAIWYKGKKTHLGHFQNKEEAARVYQEEAKRLYGEYAYTGPLLNQLPYIEKAP